MASRAYCSGRADYFARNRISGTRDAMASFGSVTLLHFLRRNAGRDFAKLQAVREQHRSLPRSVTIVVTHCSAVSG